MEKMYRVLLANNSEEFSNKLASVLKQSDRYAVVGAANDGARAIDLLRQVRPEFLVVDTMLVQADGIAVIRAANSLERKPRVLVLDEPTAGLDPQGKKEILELVKKLKESYVKTVIMISHNMDEIAEYCNRVIVLNDSKLIYDTTPRELFSNPEKLKETGLEVPHVVAISSMLKEGGIDLGETPLTKEEFISLLTRRLKCEK